MYIYTHTPCSAPRNDVRREGLAWSNLVSSEQGDRKVVALFVGTPSSTVGVESFSQSDSGVRQKNHVLDKYRRVQTSHDLYVL